MTKGQVCPAPVFSPRALVLAGILHMSLSPTTQAVTNPNYSRDKAVLISTAFFVPFIKLTLYVTVSYELFTEGLVFIIT